MPKTILIVDDDAEMLRLVKHILLRGGFVIETALSAAQALDKIAANPPDLFLLDVMMPEVNGIQLCKQLRENSQTSKTPIIMLSAGVDTETIQTAYKAGADDYVTKPFLHRDLMTKVQAALGMEPT